MDIEILLETTYGRVFKEIEAKEIFKTEKQKQKWWEQVNNALNYTATELARLQNSKVLIGLEILSDSCCEECKKINGEIYNSDSIPIIPLVNCNRMRSGQNCNCCYLPVVD